MELIAEKIFKQSFNNIDKNDLKHVIGEEESLELEFKQIDHFHKGRPLKNNEKEEKIIEELVAFLNSIKGSGLLILGIEAPDEVATNIIGVDKAVLKQLKTQFSLESFINAKIRSIPQYSNDFVLRTREIEYENGRYIYLIEVKRENSYCVYFSGVTEKAYRRQNHKSVQIKLNEILEIIANNNYPQIYVSLNNVKAEINKNKDQTVRFAIKYQNKGPSPTKDCNILVYICSNDDSHIQHRVSRYTFDPNSVDLSIHDLEFIKSDYDNIKGFEYFVHQNNRIIYPFKTYPLDSFNISYKNDLNIDLFILCLEKRGFTKQKFNIKVISSLPEYNQEVSEFRPYITL